MLSNCCHRCASRDCKIRQFREVAHARNWRIDCYDHRRHPAAAIFTVEPPQNGASRLASPAKAAERSAPKRVAAREYSLDAGAIAKENAARITRNFYPDEPHFQSALRIEASFSQGACRIAPWALACCMHCRPMDLQRRLRGILLKKTSCYLASARMARVCPQIPASAA